MAEYLGSKNTHLIQKQDHLSYLYKFRKGHDVFGTDTQISLISASIVLRTKVRNKLVE